MVTVSKFFNMKFINWIFDNDSLKTGSFILIFNKSINYLNLITTKTKHNYFDCLAHFLTKIKKKVQQLSYSLFYNFLTSVFKHDLSSMPLQKPPKLPRLFAKEYRAQIIVKYFVDPFCAWVVCTYLVSKLLQHVSVKQPNYFVPGTSIAHQPLPSRHPNFSPPVVLHHSFFSNKFYFDLRLCALLFALGNNIHFLRYSSFRFLALLPKFRVESGNRFAIELIAIVVECSRSDILK